jgi:hypothetical protein
LIKIVLVGVHEEGLDEEQVDHEEIQHQTKHLMTISQVPSLHQLDTLTEAVNLYKVGVVHEVRREPILLLVTSIISIVKYENPI